MLDLIFLDRVDKLKDQDSHCTLRLKPEVDTSVTIDGAYCGRELIQGRVDWALNYKSAVKPGTILIVCETKRPGYAATGLPQLLVYMAGVLESSRDRTIRVSFDLGTFTLHFLMMRGSSTNPSHINGRVANQRSWHISTQYSLTPSSHLTTPHHKKPRILHYGITNDT
jgi:hypothetical protein